MKVHFSVNISLLCFKNFISSNRSVTSLDQLLEKLSIESIKPKLTEEQIDLDSLLMLSEEELKVLRKINCGI